MATIDQMQAAENVHQTFLKAYNTGDADRIDGVCADDFVAYHTAEEAPIEGVEAYKERIHAVREGFSDFEMELVELISDGATSAGLYRWSGTHDGEFAGIPPTDEHVETESLTMLTVDEEGKATELRVFGSDLSIMRQLGALDESTSSM